MIGRKPANVWMVQCRIFSYVLKKARGDKQHSLTFEERRSRPLYYRLRCIAHVVHCVPKIGVGKERRTKIGPC